MSIPASFRRVLEAADPNYRDGDNAELVIVYGDHRRNYLECYTMEAIDEVDGRTTDTANGGQLQLHGSGGYLDGLGTQLQRPAVGEVGVPHPECHAAGGRAVLVGEVPGGAARLAIAQQSPSDTAFPGRRRATGN